MGGGIQRPTSGDVLQGAAADCNSAGETHAWFDSRVAHHSPQEMPNELGRLSRRWAAISREGALAYVTRTTFFRRGLTILYSGAQRPFERSRQFQCEHSAIRTLCPQRVAETYRRQKSINGPLGGFRVTNGLSVRQAIQGRTRLARHDTRIPNCRTVTLRTRFAPQFFSFFNMFQNRPGIWKKNITNSSNRAL